MALLPFLQAIVILARSLQAEALSVGEIILMDNWEMEQPLIVQRL
jgi:hypothetical protein